MVKYIGRMERTLPGATEEAKIKRKIKYFRKILVILKILYYLCTEKY
jgi:hypothetical protein